MEKSVLCIIFLLYFSGHKVTGTTASPCETNNYSECIQNLARTVQTLQQRVDTLSTQMDHQTNLLDQQLSQLVSQSMQINETRANVAKLKNDYVPIGFIYVQLPKQQPPSSIWSTSTWLEITNEYAGLFFRVLGEGSANFGVTQQESSPRLTKVTTQTAAPHVYTIDTTPSAWSVSVSSGAHPQVGNHWRLRFLVSGGEVRPRNQAVRIWKRIA